MLPSARGPCSLQVYAKVQDAVERGAKVAIGGSRPSFGGRPESGGSFFEPTVLTGGLVS